jgi:dihydroxyacetone kinase-like protein
LKFGDDPQVWACWLYYEDRLTQGEVADAMGISRATVNAYLADARERGIVNITLDPQRLASLTVAQELKRHFGLHDCLVVPSSEPAASLIDRLGAAGSLVLRQFVRSGDTIAVGWGRTVLSVAAATNLSGLQDVRVVQATGGVTTGQPDSPEICAARLAAAIQAQCVPITAPSIVSSAAMRDMLMAEPLIQSQFQALGEASRALFGISSLRPNSTIHSSGFFDSAPLQTYLALNAVGVIAGRFIDVQGRPVAGPLEDRTLGLSLEALRGIERRIAVAGGIDKVPSILGTLRGGYADILVTDAATGKALLEADGVQGVTRPAAPRTTTQQTAPAEFQRRHVKKFLNDPDNIVDEMLEGALRAHGDYLVPVPETRRAFMSREAPREGKVALVVGGGSGHEPCFLGYVGRGMADAVAVGNVFSSPPPDPIAKAARAVSGGEGVLFIYGNYAGDTMNFEMAAELVQADGLAVRTIVTTDDIASSRVEDRDGRRGVAGNVLIFKVAGAACDNAWSLDACERVARKANLRTYTMGIALEPCSMPQTRRYNFSIGPQDMEVGVGIHGEPGVAREPMQSADAVVDMVMNRIFTEMPSQPGDRVAVLVNSFGSTPLMELYVLYRRVEQRLKTKGLTVEARWVGHYCTSLDMVGASISVMHLDDELAELLAHPCDTPALRVG